MKRKEFLNILQEENVEFHVNEDRDVFVRDAIVLIYRNFRDEDAYIIPEKSSIQDGLFDTIPEAFPLSEVTREDVMRMVEAYRKTYI